MLNCNKEGPDLEICIPTFNRPVQLRKNIDSLLELRKKFRFRILVIDNCSSINLFDERSYTGIDGLTFIRNGANVGGQANVLRCFEYSQSEYLWIIGDDDFVGENAINTALQTINENREVDIFNLRCLAPGHDVQRKEYKGVNRKEFFRSIGTINAIYYVVGYIFKAQAVKGNLRIAYLNLNYFCPHLSVVFAAREAYFYSSNRLIHTWTEESDTENSLSPFPLLLSVPNVLSEARSTSEYLLLWKYLRRSKKNFIHPLKLVFVVLECAKSGVSRKANVIKCLNYLQRNEVRIPTIIGIMSVLVSFIISLSAPFSVTICEILLRKFRLKGRRIKQYSVSDERI